MDPDGHPERLDMCERCRRARVEGEGRVVMEGDVCRTERCQWQGGRAPTVARAGNRVGELHCELQSNYTQNLCQKGPTWGLTRPTLAP